MIARTKAKLCCLVDNRGFNATLSAVIRRMHERYY